MEKAFTEISFQTNYNVCIEKVSYKGDFKYSLSLEFSGEAKKIINCVRSKQTPFYCNLCPRGHWDPGCVYNWFVSSNNITTVWTISL